MTETSALRDRLIVALDFDTAEAARDMVLRCESKTGFFKVGLELFMVDWFNTVDWIIARGHKVMLDLKFFDIPETVKRAVAQVSARRVSLLTVHGNESIIKAAVSARAEVKILAVTVLTSFGEHDLQELGPVSSIAELVRHRARCAHDAGCDGVVLSGQEAAAVRTDVGSGLLLVTPGIRPATVAAQPRGDDQRRVMTAGEAINAGADYLVVGRPITRAGDPLAVIEQMQREMSSGNR